MCTRRLAGDRAVSMRSVQSVSHTHVPEFRASWLAKGPTGGLSEHAGSLRTIVQFLKVQG